MALLQFDENIYWDTEKESQNQTPEALEWCRESFEFAKTRVNDCCGAQIASNGRYYTVIKRGDYRISLVDTALPATHTNVQFNIESYA